MRFHRLAIQAFGPFADRVEIDLDTLGADGLFLMHGPTGSGKTTILDAIVFALYQRVPGARAGAAQLRSHLAPDALATEVELTFSAAGRRFRVRRGPSYERPKRSGAGTTTQRPFVEFQETTPGRSDEGTRNMREAAELIEAAIGLTADQFERIVLLPQGEFARFLRAGPDEREEILRRLFGTQRFLDAQEQLAEGGREARRAIEEERRAWTELLTRAAEHSKVHLPVPERALGALDTAEVRAHLGVLRRDAREHLDTATRIQITASHAAEEAQRAAEESSRSVALRQRLDLWRTEIAQLEEQATMIEADRARLRTAQRAEELRTIAERRSQAAADGEAADARTDALRAALRAATPAYLIATGDDHDASGLADRDHTAESWAQLADGAAERLRTLEDITRLDREAAVERTREADAQARQTRAATGLADAETRLAGHREALGPLRTGLRSPAELDEALRRAEEATARAVETVELIARRRDLEAALADAESTVDSARRRSEQLSAEVEELRRLRLVGMAGEIARDLRDGCACPVCGSTAHPEPADPAAENAAEDTRLAAERADAAMSALADARVAREARVTELHRLREQTGGQEPEEAAEELRRRREHRQTVVAEREAAEIAQRAVTAAEESMRLAEREIGTTRQLDREAAAELAGASARRASAEERRESLLRPLRLQGLLSAEGVPDAEALDDLSERERAFGSAVRRMATASAEREQLRQRGAQLDDDWAEALHRTGITPSTLGEALLEPEEQHRLERAIEDHDLRRAAAERDRAAPWHASARREDASMEDLVSRAEVSDRRAETAARRRDSAELQMHEQRRGVDRLDQVESEYLRRVATGARALARGARRVELAQIVTATAAANQIRMTLASFALLTQFREAVAAASQRLQSMSRGRFLLVPDESVVRGSPRAGLGLAVLDSYSGTLRDPRTLSGGETFLASLALALGLADAVAAENGGRLLDSLFIDEGFGSLDPDALAEVIGILDELRAGGRTIGVISHVSELRRVIPVGLAVEPSPNGSRVRQTSG